MTRRAVVLCLALAAGCVAAADAPPEPARAGAEDGRTASGRFRPAGPVRAPVRVDVAGRCVIDLGRDYDVAGDLTGAFEIDFRILVQGPCGSPPGTFDEEWIARGSFAGEFRGAPATSGFVYTADARAGGAFEGELVMGDGLEGVLAVSGDFNEDVVRYNGRLERSP